MREGKAPPTRAQLRRAFSLCLRRLRARAGISQERLAHEAGIDRAYMSELERGLHSPNLDTIYRLLPPLRVSFTVWAAEYEGCLKRARRLNNQE